MKPGRQLRPRAEIGQEQASVCRCAWQRQGWSRGGRGCWKLFTSQRAEDREHRWKEELCELRHPCARQGLSLVSGHFPSQLP